MALADGLTVSRTSSEPLRDIRKLQDQLRATEGEQAKGGRGGGPAMQAGDYRGDLAAATATGSLKSEVAGKPRQGGPDSDKAAASYAAIPAEPSPPPVEMPAAKKVQEAQQGEAKADEAMLRERAAKIPAADQLKDTAIARAEPHKVPAPVPEEKPRVMKAKTGGDGSGEDLGVNAGFPTPAPRGAAQAGRRDGEGQPHGRGRRGHGRRDGEARAGG